ncbi:uncharacterized protein CELE_F28B1.1 [Caenorhabditis elegans]|uniref:Uncharacterized protein n=1 Tax=Caenorhabditis elegans TaxID=6239 RepID=O45411_CAEEL|nr:Uncharacterized protein CELE_F28B1.1 [Caenorhabditis elegans]CAB04208.2 Uncharacterized protein CELE_F28B1.1 [Caenorhabditis elegans]|eukprot:NP_507316.2 Uncharacterized protein CELE_F28B1.1 [Caenorhabditis elegans]
MRIFLLIVYFLLQDVSGCLVLHDYLNPDMRGCKCPAVKLFNQEDVRKNEGGRYLEDHQVWDPIVESVGDCFLRIMCKPVPGVRSFLTVLFRSNGPPIYINRVVANQSTFVEQPRSIGDFGCKEYNGGYAWFFHEAVIEDLSFACVADSHSCDCPQIEVDTDSGAIVTNQMPLATDQCGFINARCSASDDKPFLYSTTTDAIYSGKGKGGYASSIHRYEDLLCVRGKELTWYIGNLKLDNLVVKCNTDERAQWDCGMFKAVISLQEFKPHHIIGVYSQAQLGTILWMLGDQFQIICEPEYKPVVFSANNEPIEISDQAPAIECAYNPMTNFASMWVVNGIRVFDPAGAWIKLET